MARKDPPQHPSIKVLTTDVVAEIAYRVYLMRLEPQMTPEQCKTQVRYDDKGKRVNLEAQVRRNSICYQPMVREAARVMWDMGWRPPNE